MKVINDVEIFVNVEKSPHPAVYSVTFFECLFTMACNLIAICRNMFLNCIVFLCNNSTIASGMFNKRNVPLKFCLKKLLGQKTFSPHAFSKNKNVCPRKILGI